MCQIDNETPQVYLSDQDVSIHLQGIIDALEDKKAIDIVSLDLRDKSAMADYFIVCSGNSRPHTRAVAEAAYGYVKDHNLEVYSIEGKQEGAWVLLDIGIIVIHVMQASQREFYNLEQLWSHAQKHQEQQQEKSE